MRKANSFLLGMKQTQKNPWDEVLERYPEGQDVVGKVRNLTNYGAFIELEEGIDGCFTLATCLGLAKLAIQVNCLKRSGAEMSRTKC